MKGINKQGCHAIYRNQGNNYHRGHLVPKKTYSSSQKLHDSTYAYTNSVPQRPNFNVGQWCQFERRIRRYAEEICTQGQPAGTLYLLTGTSLARIQQHGNNNPQLDVDVNRLRNPNNFLLSIVIPNSLWTAGCCVRPNGQNTQGFAVIGNNVNDVNQMFTQQVTVARLQNILAADVDRHNIGGPNVHLFPGNAACSAANNNVNLPLAQGGG